MKNLIVTVILIITKFCYSQTAAHTYIQSDYVMFVTSGDSLINKVDHDFAISDDWIIISPKSDKYEGEKFNKISKEVEFYEGKSGKITYKIKENFISIMDLSGVVIYFHISYMITKREDEYIIKGKRRQK